MKNFLNKLAMIAAIVPVYQENGDVTMVVYQDGTNDIVPLRVRAVIRKIAHTYCTDLIQLKKKTAEITDRSLYNTLVFDQALILIPLKTRKPRVPGDNTLAYVNLKAVVKTLPSPAPPHRSVIQLTGGHTVPIYWTPVRVKQYLNQAELISQKLADKLPRYQKQKEDEPELNAVAQKLAELLNEIVKVKGS